MNGLELAAQYYNELFSDAFRKDFPQIASLAAVGLVGNGSECFGYDDELSRDHDWGVNLCIWLPDSLRDQIPVLDVWQKTLLEGHPQFPMQKQSGSGSIRGAVTISDFYIMYTGMKGAPQTIEEWRRIPEYLLALSVNGEVFSDPTGEFTSVRNQIKRYVPEDLRKKRLAAECMALAQTGQYNLPRTIRRGDIPLEQMIAARFSSEVIKTAFLLKKRFKPYYKWEFRAMEELGPFGKDLKDKLTAFLLLPASGARIEPAEQICLEILSELHRQGLCRTEDPFLTAAGQEIQDSIGDERLKNLPPQVNV